MEPSARDSTLAYRAQRTVVSRSNAGIGRPRTTVVTPIVVAEDRRRVWERLVFFEAIEERPPLLLRLLLPTPCRTEAKPQRVGDEIRCRYRGGQLVKRVTRMDPPNLYAFAVVDQDLRVGGVRLREGWYGLRELPGGRTEIEAGTIYESPWRPRWLFGPLELRVCRAFHHHVLRAVAAG